MEAERPTIIIERMMPPVRRLAALLAAMLFLLSGAGDAFGAHPCPHHAGIGVPGQDVSADAHHGHEAHHPQPAAPEGHDGHDACTCGGVCPIGSGPAPLADGGIFHLPLLLAAPAPAARTEQAELPSRLAPHFLPFAQAPPPQA